MRLNVSTPVSSTRSSKSKWLLCSGAVPDGSCTPRKKKTPRDLLLVFGKVLRRHDGLDQDRIVHGVEHGVKLLHQLARVAHARIAHLTLYVDLRAGGRLQSPA